MNIFLKVLADIRTVIAAVLGIIGVYLLVCSAFLNGPDEMAKTGDINANLWAGLALLVIAGFMATWWIISSKAESAKSTESAENKDKSTTGVD
ncbi:hypothetical protein [Actinomyces oricola]|uniref:hypothetical protein n=1 Tax=Actinomyces oricola TaxID=206043 RepID=UPI0019D43772|nr:hypothetical protein [Actinomyces oricola]